MKVQNKLIENNPVASVFVSDKFHQSNEIDQNQIENIIPLLELLKQNKEAEIFRNNDINEPESDQSVYESLERENQIELGRATRRIFTHFTKAHISIYEIRKANGAVENLFLKINPIEELLSQNMYSTSVQLKDSSEFYSHHPFRWIKGQVPYELSDAILHKSNSALKKALLSCINFMNKKTVIKFNPKTETSPDYIYFDIDTTTLVPIGRYPGKNHIKIHPKTEKFQIFHYLMHTLGFVHEVKKQNSKPLGYILNSNIQNSQISATEKIKFICGDTLGPYDKYSVLNQLSCYYQELNPHEKQEKVKELSKLDIKKIDFFYGRRRCSYDFYKVPYFQTYYLCIDCWGESKFFICFYCREFHHDGHEVKKISYEEAGSVSCCCGIIGHRNACSVYLKKAVSVQGVRCKTCEDYQMGGELKIGGAGKGCLVCFRCFAECHRGHEIAEEKFIDCEECMCGKDGMVTNCCMKE